MNFTISFDYLYNRSANLYLDAGIQNFSKRGDLLSYADQEHVSYNKKDAWNQAVKLDSCLEFLLPPISSSPKVEIYLREQYRSVRFVKKKEVIEEQFNLNIMEWDPLNFHHNPEIYDSKILGSSNLTRFEGYSLFVTLPNFARGEILII